MYDLRNLMQDCSFNFSTLMTAIISVHSIEILSDSVQWPRDKDVRSCTAGIDNFTVCRPYSLAMFAWGRGCKALRYGDE